MGGKMELSLDNNFGLRYANMVSIINSVEKYLEKSPERNRFIQKKTDVKTQIKLNDLLKNEKSQLIVLAEFILFISVISSKLDYWLDKIEKCEEKQVNHYCEVTDSFLVSNGRNDDSVRDSSVYKNYETLQHSNSKQIFFNDKIVKKCEDLEKEKLELHKNIHEIEKETQTFKDKYFNMEKNYIDLDYKYKDAIREVEILKSSNKSNIKVQEELLQESIQINQLKGQLQQKDMEIEDIKKDHELQLKTYMDEKSKLREKLEIYEDKMSQFKSLNNENEKLKNKIKEYSLLKEKQLEYDDIVLNLESKNRMIDSLIKEKQGHLTQIEKLNKDILAEREKCRNIDFEKKKMDYELNDIKKDYSRMENNLRNKEAQVNNYSTLSEMKRSSMTGTTEYGTQHKENLNLFQLDQSSVIYDIEKNNEDRVRLLENEVEELKQDKNELIKQFKEQSEEVMRITVDKEKIVTRLEEVNLEFKRMISERDKLSIEKEKIMLDVQKVELDFKKNEINYEIERKKIEEDLKETLNKLKKLTLEKEGLVKELEVNRKENYENLQKLLKEKQALMTDYQKEMEKMKLNFEKEVANIKSKKQPVANPEVNTSSEMNNYKQEIINLKSNITQKDDIIKNYQNKLKSLESENNNVSSQMQDTVDKFNQDIIRRSEDLEFYKRSYEEQKNRVNREHELISSSLYELALQFMSLKNELHKKVNTNSKNWLDNERAKNFPLDK